MQIVNNDTDTGQQKKVLFEFTALYMVRKCA